MKRFWIGFLLAVLCALFACASVFAQEEFDDDTVIVVMKPQIGGVSLMSVSSRGYDFGSLGISEVKKIAELDEDGMSLFSAGSSTKEMLCLTLTEGGADKVLEAVDALNEMDIVDYAQPNYTYHLDASANDYYYYSQYALSTVSAPAVWDIGIDCSDTVIAVLDSGVNLNHEDLKNNLWVDANGNNGWDFVDNDSVPDDTLGHGTHVAGIVSAVTNNRTGVASLARNAKIAVFKVFDGVTGSTSEVCEALQYMIKYEKKHGKTFSVINCSFAGPSYDRSLYSMIRSCSDKVVVTAAGNDGVSLSETKAYPACYSLSNIICVANSTRYDTLASSSNYSSSYVDIAAPGSSILSTYHTSNDAYALMGGTSMAAPLVSSAVAALRAKCPDLSASQAISYISSGADYVSDLNGYVSGGRRLNAYKSIALALSPVTVTFNSNGGSSVSRQSLSYAECASEPEPPTKTGYDFNGWLLGGKPYNFSSAVTEDITLTASWTIKSFTITWRLDDNTTLDRDTVTYGTVPSHDDAQKDSDAEYDYVFTGWSPRVTAATRDTVYTAVFDKIRRSYNVTWKYEDNSILETDTVLYGTVPYYTAPDKASDDEYDYKFTGWSPEVTAVTGNAEYTAVYTAVQKNSGVKIETIEKFIGSFELVRFAGADGSAVITAETIGSDSAKAPDLVVFIAEYDEEGNTLLSADRIAFCGGAVIPDMRGRNCRIFIWTDENEPVTECITDMDSFFSFINTLD